LRGSQAAFSCFGSRRKSRFGARPRGATLRIEKSKRSGSGGEAYQNFEDRCEEWGE
jgi:hypothetical protein